MVYISPDELENANSFHLNPVGHKFSVHDLPPLGGSAGSGGGRDESGPFSSPVPLGVLDPRPLLSTLLRLLSPLPREVARDEGREDGLGFALGADASRRGADPVLSAVPRARALWAPELDAPGSGP